MTASFQGIDLYVDEKKLSPLTSAQQIEFAEYQKQMADYERVISQCYLFKALRVSVLIKEMLLKISISKDLKWFGRLG